MHSLDAGALTQDPDGMAFLSAVLGPAAGREPVRDAFDLEASRCGWTVRPSGEDLRGDSQRVLRIVEAV